jgi:hypothetical protein
VPYIFVGSGSGSLGDVIVSEINNKKKRGMKTFSGKIWTIMSDREKYF